MKFLRATFSICLMAGIFLSAEANAANQEKTDKPISKDIVLNGDAKCTSCHDESDAPNVLHIGKTRHGTKSDKSAPTCTSCHGESNKHINHKGSDKPPQPDITFGKNTKNDAQNRNGACLTCHEDSKRMNWKLSKHSSQDVACTSCHQVHNGKDKVRDKTTQSEVCFTCHKEQRTQANKPSHHPIPEGKMGCSDCHNPHGSTGPKMLIKDSVNATCYTCHAEKRGPFIHNHAPVSEDCANCHNPHGTVANAMLKSRPPFLCLQCHDSASHPGNVPGVVSSTANTAKNGVGTVLNTGATNNFNANNSFGNNMGRACLNCHTEIHGSNNPANSSRALRFWR